MRRHRRGRVMRAAEHWASYGVYTPSQAAQLLSISTAMVNRWLYGDARHDAAVTPQVPEHDRQLLTFIDLIQAMAIRDIRTAKHGKHLSLQKVRQTVNEAKRLGVLFPFARRHTAYVFSDDVVIRLPDDRLIQVTGKYRNNDLIEPVVYSYLDDLGFDDQGFAAQLVPLQRGLRKVILSPAVNYGAPTITPGNYTVATLVAAARSEGGPEAAADLCDVNVNDVLLALDYERKLAA